MLILICLATVMIRWAVTMALLFVIFKNLGWSGSCLPPIFLRRREHFTIALGLTYFLDRDRRLWDLATAGDTMADAVADTMEDLPVIPVLVLAQRACFEGIALTGIKG